MTDLIQLAEAVKKMRVQQNEYFRTKSSIALNNSKKLEKDVDAMVLEIVPSPQEVIIHTQNTLFDS